MKFGVPFRPSLVSEIEQVHEAQVSLVGVGSLTSVASLNLDGAASLEGIGLISAAGKGTVSASALLAGEGLVSPTGAGILRQGQIALIGESFLSPSGTNFKDGQVSMIGEGALSAVGGLVLGGQVSLIGTGTIAPTGFIFQDVGLTLIAQPGIWAVVIAELNGPELEEVPHKNLQMSWALDEPGGCGFVLPLRHEKTVRSLLEPGQREIHIYRQGSRVWGGYLWYAGASSNDPTVRFAGEGYLSRLFRRHVDEDLIYSDIDQLQIAWNVINWAQIKIIGGVSGNLGIVRDDPTENSGINRTARFRYWERQKVGDILQDLSEKRNGFDFEITPDKRWKTFFPQKGIDSNHVFELGKNIGSIAFDIDAARTISEFSALGAGDRKRRCIAVVSDATSLADFGILQDSESLPNVKKFGTLQDHAETALAARRKARSQPQVTVVTDDPLFEEYSVGDRVRIRAKQGYIDIDSTLSLVTINLQLTDEGREATQLFFDEVAI